jgi:hypothetical protein
MDARFVARPPALAGRFAGFGLVASVCGLRENHARELVPAIESLAGVFHSLTTTFPLSALVAPILLIPWRSRNQVFRSGLRKRFGWLAWVIYLALLISAIAAIAKPFIYATPELVPPLCGRTGGRSS